MNEELEKLVRNYGEAHYKNFLFKRAFLYMGTASPDWHFEVEEAVFKELRLRRDFPTVCLDMVAVKTDKAEECIYTVRLLRNPGFQEIGDALANVNRFIESRTDVFSPDYETCPRIDPLRIPALNTLHRTNWLRNISSSSLADALYSHMRELEMRTRQYFGEQLTMFANNLKAFDKNIDNAKILLKEKIDD